MRGGGVGQTASSHVPGVVIPPGPRCWSPPSGWSSAASPTRTGMERARIVITWAEPELVPLDAACAAAPLEGTGPGHHARQSFSRESRERTPPSKHPSQAHRRLIQTTPVSDVDLLDPAAGRFANGPSSPRVVTCLRVRGRTSLPGPDSGDAEHGLNSQPLLRGVFVAQRVWTGGRPVRSVFERGCYTFRIRRIREWRLLCAPW